MAKQPWGGRPNKAALARIKLGTAVVSIAAFVASLGGVAYLNPGIHNTTGLNSQAQAPSTRAALGSARAQLRTTPLQLPGLQQQASIVPLTRTRGS